MLTIGHGNVSHLKKRSNTRLMLVFAIKGVERLNENRLEDYKAF